VAVRLDDGTRVERFRAYDVIAPMAGVGPDTAKANVRDFLWPDHGARQYQEFSLGCITEAVDEPLLPCFASNLAAFLKKHPVPSGWACLATCPHSKRPER